MIVLIGCKSLNLLLSVTSRDRVLFISSKVFSIGLLADKKYHQFRPVLDAYIQNMFSATKAYT